MLKTLKDLIQQEEEHVESIFYHSRRDWERQHLTWRQNVEEDRRTKQYREYEEPVMRTKETIREACYVKVPLSLIKEIVSELSKKRKRKGN